MRLLPAAATWDMGYGSARHSISSLERLQRQILAWHFPVFKRWLFNVHRFPFLNHWRKNWILVKLNPYHHPWPLIHHVQVLRVAQTCGHWQPSTRCFQFSSCPSLPLHPCLSAQTLCCEQTTAVGSPRTFWAKQLSTAKTPALRVQHGAGLQSIPGLASSLHLAKLA